jgi:hypothetical protein
MAIAKFGAPRPTRTPKETQSETWVADNVSWRLSAFFQPSKRYRSTFLVILTIPQRLYYCHRNWFIGELTKIKLRRTWRYRKIELDKVESK